MLDHLYPAPALFYRLLVVVCLLTVTGCVAQDVWVSVGNRLESGQEAMTVPNTSYLTGLFSYTEAGQVVFLVTDTSKRGNAPLFKIQDKNIFKIFEDSNSTYFESVIYSPQSRTIYMTSPSTSSIVRLGDDGDQTVKFDNLKPAGLTIDPCTSTVYWSSTASDAASIMAWKEGIGSISQSKVWISDGLRKPRGLTVDVQAGQLYWTDQKRDKFYIYRRGLDGGEVEQIYEEVGGEPFSLAVTPTWIYWSDWARASTWRINKTSVQPRAELVKLYKFSKPNGITYVPNQALNCSERYAVTVSPNKTSSSSTSAPETEASAQPSATNTTHRSDIVCLEGEADPEGYCECNEGWVGPHCQTSLCHNYCISGVCSIIESHPVCYCRDGYTGDRCEIAVLSPAILPLETINVLIFSLSAVILLQFVVILILSVFLHRNRKRPRIVRKRFISASKYADKVGKENTGSCGLPTQDGVQLDIEDCCNMAMCDTPCFDPPTRAGKKVCSTRKPEKPDKRALLEHHNEDDYNY